MTVTLDPAKVDRTLDLIASQVMLADAPVVLSSFGKDSLVLLHLCRQVNKGVPALFFVQHAQQFPEKYRHAMAVIEAWGLACYSLPPRGVTHVQQGDYFDLFQFYGSPDMGPLIASTGLRPRELGEEPFVCALDSLLAPTAEQVTYPWDLTFLGHKASDEVKLTAGQGTKIHTPVIQSGATTLCLPLWDWTDADVWAYIHAHHLPYDQARYDAQDEAVNPDQYPACFNCLDARKRGQSVYCPKVHDYVTNRAQPWDWHHRQRNQLLGSVHYATFDVPAMDRRHSVPARFLDFEEHWPLWSLRKVIDRDQVFVCLNDVVDVSSKADGLRRLRQEWIRVERACARAGLAGWLTCLDDWNTKTARVVRATGAVPYAMTGTDQWYIKRVDPAHLHFPTLREMAKTILTEAQAHA